jgi:putative acetyltransferase
MSASKIQLLQVNSSALFVLTQDILREYAQSLDTDLCFQNFEEEIRTLPGKYANPEGLLLLAQVNGNIAGCGAMRALPTADYPNACEMKRLYVRPKFRGMGVGQALVEALMDAARMMGYSSMLLDTLTDMEAARHLYASFGFEEIPPYYFNPIAGAHYLKAQLNEAGVLRLNESAFVPTTPSHPHK